MTRFQSITCFSERPVHSKDHVKEHVDHPKDLVLRGMVCRSKGAPLDHPTCLPIPCTRLLDGFLPTIRPLMGTILRHLHLHLCMAILHLQLMDTRYLPLCLHPAMHMVNPERQHTLMIIIFARRIALSYVSYTHVPLLPILHVTFIYLSPFAV